MSDEQKLGGLIGLAKRQKSTFVNSAHPFATDDTLHLPLTVPMVGATITLSLIPGQALEPDATISINDQTYHVVEDDE